MSGEKYTISVDRLAGIGLNQALLHLPVLISNFTFPAVRILISKSCKASVLLLLGSTSCCNA